MKKILLIGGDDVLLNELLDYGDRIGGFDVSRLTDYSNLAAGQFDLVIMDSLAEDISPIAIIKTLAVLSPMPAFGLLMTHEDAGKRIQEAFFQYARAKGIRHTIKLKYPLFFGDMQALISRSEQHKDTQRTKVPLQINTDMLRAAIDQREFKVHFQPKIALKSQHVIGAEALIRWQHPNLGMIMPDAFMPVIEECGLMSEMTWLVLEGALEQVWEWRRLGYDFKVAVNFSASTFSTPGISRIVLDMIRAAHLYPDCLSIELTESAMVQNLDILLESLMELYKNGIEISIDDFGTGYSSLHQVSVIPASELKVDQSFVRDMLDNTVDHLIVRNTVRMAHSLGMRALAEGVETKRHVQALARTGCDEAQGYFYSRPIDEQAFRAYANNNPVREVTRYFNLNKL